VRSFVRACSFGPRQSHHHYSKVVSTHYEVASMFSSASSIMGYQMLTQSQIMHYDEARVVGCAPFGRRPARRWSSPALAQRVLGVAVTSSARAVVLGGRGEGAPPPQP
jgi:hypothetical protein